MRLWTWMNISKAAAWGLPFREAYCVYEWGWALVSCWCKHVCVCDYQAEGEYEDEGEIEFTITVALG